MSPFPHGIIAAGGASCPHKKKKSPWVLDKLRAQTTHSDQVGDKVVPNFPD